MDDSRRDELQPPSSDDDIVAEFEKIARRLSAQEGNVTIEAVFSNGLYVRGFVHRGPLARDELRALDRSS